MPDSSTSDPAPQLPHGGGIIGAVGQAATRVAALDSKGMNNIVLILSVTLIGLLIYTDRRDRAEYRASDLRYYESQSEQNRQIVQSNTAAVQALSVSVGKLESTVNSLHRTVTSLRPPGPPEETTDAPMPHIKGERADGKQ
jgi:hypothetical protein